jgi:hypothetical protein
MNNIVDIPTTTDSNKGEILVILHLLQANLNEFKRDVDKLLFVKIILFLSLSIYTFDTVKMILLHVPLYQSV